MRLRRIEPLPLAGLSASGGLSSRQSPRFPAIFYDFDPGSNEAQEDHEDDPREKEEYGLVVGSRAGVRDDFVNSDVDHKACCCTDDKGDDRWRNIPE